MIACNIVIIASNLIGVIYRGRVGSGVGYVLKTFNFFEFFFTAVLFGVFSLYFLRLSSTKKKSLLPFTIIAMLFITIYQSWNRLALLS
jgi:hypothetical protein